MLVLAVLFSSFFGFVPLQQVYAEDTVDQTVYMDSSYDVEERVEALLSQMTLEEKIGQMLHVERASLKPEDVRTYSLGSVFSGGGSWPNGNGETNELEDWLAMTTEFQNYALETRLGVPILYGVDAVHGHNNVVGATIFPHNIGLGATGDLELVERVGKAVSEEVRATGIHWTYAPMVGVPQDYRWGRTYEGFSEDVDLVSNMGVAFTKGLQGQYNDEVIELSEPDRTIATLKHYIGEGQTKNGANKGNVEDYTWQELIENFAKPYEEAIKAGARTVMMSYNSIQGQRCHGHKEIIDYLKNDSEDPELPGLGFTGFVVSDYNGIDDLPGNFKQDIKESVNAGVDVFMTTDKWKSFITNLKDLVEVGEVSEERIDDAVRRILRVKFELGLFECPYTDESLKETFGSDEHRAIAREAVRKSLVLLKNDNKILSQLKDMDNIFVAGKNANDIGRQCGGWTISWQGKSDDDQADNMLIGPSTPGTTIWQGIKEVVLGITGPNDYDGNAMAPGNEIVEKNGKTLKYNKHGRGCTDEFDVAIAFIGENPYAEGDGDSGDLGLSTEDLTTLANIRAQNSDIPIIVVLVSGRPMNVSEQIGDWDGFVAAWLPGTEGAGIADVLFGDYDFTGKTTYSWPWFTEQFPMPIEESEALFPIGFGLTKDEEGSPLEKPEQPLPTGHDISERLEAEDVYRAKSIQTESTSDPTGGGVNIGWTEAGQWYDYVIDVPEDGLYEIGFRVSSNGGSYPALEVLNENGDAIGEPLSIEGTGGWQNWITKKNTVALYEGVQIIRINLLGGNFNFNYMEFERIGDIPDDWGIGDKEPEPIDIPSSPVTREGAVDVWFSSENNAGQAWYFSEQEIEYTLDRQEPLDLVAPTSNWDVQAITVDPDIEYQEILGIGSSMEESTVYNLWKMSEEARTEILTKLVSKDEANISLMRITCGTADFTGKEFYTYADFPYNEVPRDEDEDYYINLLEENFSIKKDIDYKIIDTLKQMQEINPDLQFFASSWTPPGWMKSKNSGYQFNELNLKGGSLQDKFIPVLAKYYRLFVEAYAEQGINIYGMTLQNEPELEINYPSCRMTAQQELKLAQAMKAEFEESLAQGKIKQIPKVWAFDHNFSSGVSFLSGILDDPAIDGAAFHDYSGEPTVMTQVHNMFPDKTVMLSERSVWGTAGADRIAQYLRNWAISYSSWVTMLDSDIYPEQWTGTPDPTMLIRDSGNADEYWMCPEYYITAQFTKFLQPGAVRIDSNYGSKSTVTNVAFKNPDGTVVVVVINQNKQDQAFRLVCKGEQISAVIPAGTVATYIFEPGTGETPIEPLKIPKADIAPGNEIVGFSGVEVTGNGDITSIDTGDYFDFYFDVPESGYYSFDSWFENENELAGDGEEAEEAIISIMKDGEVIGKMNLEVDPFWDPGMWRQTRANFYLEEGVQLIRFQADKAACATIGGTNIQKVDVNHDVPGKIEAEAFVNTVGAVTLDNTAVGYWHHETSEALLYKVNIAQPGTYKVLYRYSSGSWDSCVRVFLDDTPLNDGNEIWIGASDENLENAWGIFKTKEFDLTIPEAGEHILKLVSSGGGDHNLDWFAIGPYIEAYVDGDQIAEGREDGREIKLTLNNVPSEASNVVTPDSITLVNAPEGVDLGEIVVDGSGATIKLAGNATVDYDLDKVVTISYELKITTEDAISTTGDAIVTTGDAFILTSDIIFKATNDPESLTASWSETNGAQETIDDEVITLIIEGGYFKESELDRITLGEVAGLAGITIESYEMIDLSTVELALAWDGTPYFEDIEVTVNVPVEAYTDSRGGEALTVELISEGAFGHTNELGVEMQAQDVYRLSGVSIVDDAAGGKKMQDIGSGDWIDFKVNVPEAGIYTVDFRLGVPSDAGRLFELRAEDGTNLRTINVPQYWANWFTLRTAVELDAGEQVIRFVAVNSSDFQLKYVKIYDKTKPITITDGTTKIEAEELYDTNKGVITDLKENNQVVGKVLDYLNANDWMRYSINVEKTGIYQVTYRYSTQQGGVRAGLRKDGKLISEVSLLSTGSWESYSTASGEVRLPAGTYFIDLLDLGDGFNVDWFEFTFEEVAYVVNYDANGGTGAIPSAVAKEGDKVVVETNEGHLIAPSGKEFKEWNTKADGTGTVYKAGDEITMPASDLTLYAIWKTKSSSSPSTPSTPSTPSKPMADIGGIRVTVDVDDETGLVKVDLSDSILNNAFEKATAQDDGKKVVQLEVPKSDTGKYSVGLPTDAFTSGKGERELVLVTDAGRVVLPDSMLKGTEFEDSENIVISVNKADKSVLTTEVANEIGDRPVIELNLAVDGEKVEWNNANAPVKVSIPYEPTEEELKDPEHIVVWYIDVDGNVVPVYNGRYNVETKAVEFTTIHFSLYSIAYVHKTFDDLINVEWARKPIEVLASKGIIAGTGNGNYSPEANITRADYLVLLVKALGLTADFDDNFDDVKVGSHYYEAVGIAKALGIAAGSGNNMYYPNTPISREDMMALTYRALKLTKNFEVSGNTNVLDEFTDKGEIADYAIEAIAALVSEGFIVGFDGEISPRSETTRASAAVFLYKIYSSF